MQENAECPLIRNFSIIVRVEHGGEYRRQFGLLRAVGLSVAIHLLLLTLALFVPIASETEAVSEVDEEDEITFSFIDRFEPPEEDTPAEDVPPLGREAPAIQIPEAPPTHPPQPLEAAPDEPPGAPLETHPAETRPAVEEDLGLPTPPAEDDADAAPRRDVSQALRDFGETLERRPPGQAPAQGNSERNVIVPDFSAIPSSGFGMGNLTFESADYDWTDYGRQIYMAIWRAWHQRLWMTTDEFEKWAHESGQWQLNHQTQVRFVIQHNGQLTGIVQEGTSGCSPLDLSALDALAEVILPPLPADFPRGREVVHARFIATGPIPDMRPVLGRLKARGLF